MRLLITGAAGAIGSLLVEGLRDRYSLRGLDRVPMPGLEDALVADVADFEAVLRATQGMEAVIHLAGSSASRYPWQEVHPNNILGTYNVLEAARQNGVRRVAFASRAGLLAPYPEDQRRTVDLPPRPTSYYSVSKVFGESLGYLYATEYGLEFVSVRIGSLNLDRPQPEDPHHLSHADAVRVFERAVIHPGVTFEIVFGVSDSAQPLYDLDHGRKVLGYHPQDRSE